MAVVVVSSLTTVVVVVTMEGGEPLLKPGFVGPCPIDGFRRVEEISTSF